MTRPVFGDWKVPVANQLPGPIECESLEACRSRGPLRLALGPYAAGFLDIAGLPQRHALRRGVSAH